MLKAVKNYHYNKKKKTLQHQGIRHLEEYVFERSTAYAVIEILSFYRI